MIHFDPLYSVDYSFLKCPLETPHFYASFLFLVWNLHLCCCELETEAADSAVSDPAASPTTAKLSNCGQQNLVPFCRSQAKESLREEVMPKLVKKGMWEQQG